MKFKILPKPKVKGFSFSKGHVRYFPGDVVDLPASYLGEPWLEPLEKPVAAVPEAKMEPIQPVPLTSDVDVPKLEPVIPFETPSPVSKKRTRKKLGF